MTSSPDNKSLPDSARARAEARLKKRLEKQGKAPQGDAGRASSDALLNTGEFSTIDPSQFDRARAKSIGEKRKTSPSGLHSVRHSPSGMRDIRSMGSGIHDTRSMGSGIHDTRTLQSGIHDMRTLQSGIHDTRTLQSGIHDARAMGAELTTNSGVHDIVDVEPRLPRSKLAQLLATSLGQEKANELLLKAAVDQGYHSMKLTQEEASAVLSSLTSQPGLIGIAASLARSRLSRLFRDAE